MTIELKYENDEGEEITMSFPSLKQVCHECHGEGFILCEGMRGYAYSSEEFAEAFDDEDREEYCRRGGMYDQQCDVCHGRNVVDVVDESKLSPEQKEFYEAFQAYENKRLQWETWDRQTMRAECGYRD
jgi:hypothetical protein